MSELEPETRTERTNRTKRTERKKEDNMGTIQINFRKNFNKKPLIIKAKNIKKAVEKAAKNKIDLSGAILDKADLDGVNLKGVYRSKFC